MKKMDLFFIPRWTNENSNCIRFITFVKKIKYATIIE